MYWSGHYCIDHRESWYGGWVRVRVGWGCSETGVPLYWRNQPITMITRLLYHTNRLIVSSSFQISSVLVSVLLFSYFKHQDYYENMFRQFYLRCFYFSRFLYFCILTFRHSYYSRFIFRHFYFRHFYFSTFLAFDMFTFGIFPFGIVTFDIFPFGISRVNRLC